MKKRIFAAGSLTLALTMGLSAVPFTVHAEEDLTGKTVVLYSGNLRGEIDYYAKLASAKKDYESKGANVYLVDTGNHLQGKTYANTSRGLDIYNLMDKAGYDVAAMGAYDFSYADATAGQIWHGNLVKYHTQAQLYKGNEEQEYNKNGAGSLKGILEAKNPASFEVISSNIRYDAVTYYDFDSYSAINNAGGITTGFVALTDKKVGDMLQDNALDGYSFTNMMKPDGVDVLIALSNSGETVADAAFTICAPTDGETVIGALMIDDKNKSVEEIKDFNINTYSDDAGTKALADTVKENALPVFATSEVNLNGKDSINWTQESNLGDLVTDALVWYANNKFAGFEKDAPVVAIQNGGNCDQFLYKGDVTSLDLLRSYPFSPMGVSIVYLSGEQLETIIESSLNFENDRYTDKVCPGFAQVSGLEYVIDPGAEYIKGEKNGNWYLPDEKNDENNVSHIKTVNGEAFDPDKTYAVIADNFIVNGNDTYKLLKDAVDGGAKRLNNGNGILTRDIVEMYIKSESGLNGTIGQAYKEPQGRISYCEHPEDKRKEKDTACLKDGMHSVECEVCHTDILHEHVQAHGHKWTVDNDTDKDGWKTVTEPTVTKEGKAERTCKHCGAKESKKIDKLAPVVAKSIKVTPATVELTEGETKTLKAQVSPDDTTDKTVKWTSSDTKVATVDKNGKISAVKAGTATITATTTNGKEATAKITVSKAKVDVKSVSLNKTTATLDEGKSVELKATVSPSNANDKTIKWTSSNSKVATVDNSGKVKAIKAGTATITATTTNGKKATAKITVSKAKVDVKSVSLNKTTAALDEGKSVEFKATVSPSNATDKTIKWTSSNSKVATVDNSGKVKAIKAGTATITATSTNGKKATAKITVKKVKNGWIKEKNIWKYYKNGKAYTGWHKMGKAEGESVEHWSYFGNDGVLRTGWQKMGTKTNPDGKNKEHWSYFGANGWLRTGWQQIGKGTSNPDGNNEKHWSYFGADGWLRTGWQQLGKGTSNPDGNNVKHWSYFGANGWLRTGWQQLGKGTSNPDGNNAKHWSYFGANGWLRTNLQELGKGTNNPDGNSARHKSYFGNNGWLVINKKIRVSGKEYTADARGWLK